MSYIKKIGDRENTGWSNSTKKVFYFDGYIYLVSVISFGSSLPDRLRFQKISLDGKLILWDRTLQFSVYGYSYIKLTKLKNESSLLCFLGHSSNPYYPPGAPGSPLLIIKLDDETGNKLNIRNIPRQNATFNNSCYISDDIICLLSTYDNNSILDILDKQLNIIASKTISSTTTGRIMELTNIKYFDNKLYLLGSLVENSGNKLGLIVEMVINLTVSPPGISNLKNYSFQVKQNGNNIDFKVQSIFKNNNQFLIYANDHIISKSILLSDLSKTTVINIEGLNAGILIEANNEDSLAFIGGAYIKINKQLEILLSKNINVSGSVDSMYLKEDGLIISFYKSFFVSDYTYDRYHYFGLFNSIFESCITLRSRANITTTILSSISVPNTLKITESQKPISTEINLDFSNTQSTIGEDVCIDPVYLKLLNSRIVLSEDLQKNRQYFNLPVGQIEIHNAGTQQGTVKKGLVITDFDGFKFYLKSEDTIVPANETRTFDVFLDAKPTIAGPKVISIPSNPYAHFYNDEQYTITANVVELIEVKIIGKQFSQTIFIAGENYDGNRTKKIGTVRLQKFSGESTTIKNGKIHNPETINGLIFYIKDDVVLGNNLPVNADVYVKGEAIHDVTTPELIAIRFVDNTNIYLDITIEKEPVNAYIEKVSFPSDKIFTTEEALNPPFQEYGSITVVNNTKYSKLKIFPHSDIWNEVNNNFIFRTANTEIIWIDEISGRAVIPVEVYIPDNNTPKVAGEFDKYIDLQYLSIKLSNLKIFVKVVEKIVIKVTAKNLDLNFFIGATYNHSIGTITLQKVSGKPTTVNAGTIHYPANNLNGLRFNIPTTFLSDSTTTPVPVTVSGQPNTTDFTSHDVKINLENFINPDNLKIEFTPKKETINALITGVSLQNKVYIKDKALSPAIQDYGKISVINNTKYEDLIIPAHYLLWHENQYNNFKFRTKNSSEIRIAKDGGTGDIEIEVYIEGNNNTPTIVGDFDHNINLTSLGIGATSDKIFVHVKAEEYDVEVYAGHFPSPPMTFIRGLPPAVSSIDYGSITLKNKTETRDLLVPSGTVVAELNGFTFITKYNVNVPKSTEGGLADVEIVLYPTTPTVSDVFSALVNIQLTNPSVQIKNPTLIGIPYIVKDEEMNAEIIGTDFYTNLTYVKGYKFITQQYVGTITVRNNTQTRNLYIPANTVILSSADNRGLEFSTQHDVTIYSVNQAPQNVVTIPIVVTSKTGANDLGSFTPDLDLSHENVGNPSRYKLPFSIKEDVLDVRITDAVFNTFPTLIKGRPIDPPKPVVGQITITNYSLVKNFVLSANQRIHSNLMASLEIKITNPRPVTIRPVPEGGPAYQYTVSVTISNKTDNTPNAYGYFAELLNIPQVNTGDYDVSFDVLNDGISVTTDENFNLQAPNFALQAVGSSGIDSPTSIQLRWMFSGNLGEKHIPKGTLTNRDLTQYNYNKKNDFVKLYRVPYEAQIRTVSKVDLQQSPAIVDYDKQCWIYEVSGTRVSANSTPAKVPPKTRLIHVYFRNKPLYNQVSESYDPMSEPQAFIDAYGENVIEMECKEELFLRVIPAMRPSLSAKLFLEVLSVEENKLINSKYLSFRKIMKAIEVAKSRIFVENGRSIRYKTTGSRIYSFDFEFYSDFLTSASNWNCWESVGEYGLSYDDRSIESRLDDITSKWLKYNHGEYVDAQNYLDRWNIAPEGNNPLNRSIKEILERYISLSRKADNPKAVESINVNFSEYTDPDEEELPDDENGSTLISNLDLLNMAAMDFHVARMLGLGTMDISQGVLDGKEYIYLTEYRTSKDPNNENVPKSTQIISMSLPTSIYSSRLPLPIEIAELYKGVPKSQNDDVPVLYDEDGYSLDGKNRFISIISKPTPSAAVNPIFFMDEISWDSSQYTVPVYGGLEYRIGSSGNIKEPWVKPELSHSANYYNVDSDGVLSYRETIPIMLPEKYGDPLFVHRQITNGNYIYATYGINIFSRASALTRNFEIYTEIKPQNNLLPPSDINAWLIKPEKPLMFTSEYEQTLYHDISTRDKTLVRLSFNYNSQDIITHSIPSDTPFKDEEYVNNPTHFPDRYDVFAEEVEVYFRSETPKKITAALFKVEQDSDKLCLIFKTKTYVAASNGGTEEWKSELPYNSSYNSFVGSVFLVNNTQYVVKDVYQGQNYRGLEFIVYKEEVSKTLLAGGKISVQFNSLPIPQTSGNDLFVVTENLQSKNVWGPGNPNLALIPLTFPAVHREVISTRTEKGEQKYLEKTRGYWETAKVEAYSENGQIKKGVYKISFDTLKLDQRAVQFEKAFVELSNGIVRVFRKNSLNGGEAIKSRDHLKVIKAENFGSGPRNRLVLYVYDEERENAPATEPISEIVTGNEILVNYYPTYNVYLYSDSTNNLTANNVLPEDGKTVKYSIFGLRTIDKQHSFNNEFYSSKFSSPAIMLGQKITLPQPPNKPEGSFYATRPDFYGRSTYSFTTDFFSHEPFGVQFSRTNNTALLDSLYNDSTLKTIYINLEILGGNDEIYLKNRWDNFFDFTSLSSAGNYTAFPLTTEESKDNVTKNNEVDGSFKENIEKNAIPYAFPLPDKMEFFQGINRFIEEYNIAYKQTTPKIPSGSFGTIKLNSVIIPKLSGVHDDKPFFLIDFVKEVVENNFVPLTEIPVLYKHIKTFIHDSKSHHPVDKKQNVRDNSGYLLKPPTDDPNLDDKFDMAPMMTILNKAQRKVLFTDFTLNGTTENIYFYASREFGSQMDFSTISKVLGPVKLVNTNSPEPPKILGGIPILENKVLGINPQIKIDINAYAEFVGIKKISLYRATNRLDAESILSMTMVKELEISDLELTNENLWTLYDDLKDLNTVPYGDTLYYRTVAHKQVQYTEYVDTSEIIKTEFVPSKASKILALVLVETQNPATPIVEGSASRGLDDDFVKDLKLYWDLTCYKGIYHLYQMSSQGNWKEIARFIVNNTNNKALLQAYNAEASDLNSWVNIGEVNIINSKITFDIKLLGDGYKEFPMFDNNNIRKFYHFKVTAENTSSMFSTEDHILSLFPDSVWDNLSGISNDEKSGMAIGETFIIK